MRQALFISAMFLSMITYGQDSLLHQLEAETPVKKSLVNATFKGTHIINLESVEQPAAKELSFLMMHRFGKLNDGAYNFFGLDQAGIRLAFDYGVTDRLAVGIGRSSVDKAFDASLKLKLLRQSEGAGSFPMSVTGFTGLVFPTIKYSDKPYLTPKLRTIYSSQLLIARKFSRQLSLQLSPAWIHYNLVATASDKNNIFALSTGGRMKFTKRMSINAEYNWLPASQLPSQKLSNSFSVGWDIETGGHVFQLVFSNSGGMTAPYFLSKTTGTWGAGDIYFGFNVSRIFSFKK